MSEKKITKLLKDNWKSILNIGVLISVAALFIDLRQANTAERQLLYDQMQQPKLEYISYLAPSPTDTVVTQEVAEQLLITFYKQFYEQYQSHPNTTYFQALAQTLPLTATVPARPVSLKTRIENTGTTTSKEIHAFFKIDRLITGYHVDSLEPYREMKGGIGEDNIAIEIDRIAPCDIVEITIELEAVSNTQLDQIVLHMPEDSQTLSLTPFLGIQGSSPFPVLEYISAQRPDVAVNVTADSGIVTRQEPKIMYIPLVARPSP